MERLIEMLSIIRDMGVGNITLTPQELNMIIMGLKMFSSFENVLDEEIERKLANKEVRYYENL